MIPDRAGLSVIVVRGGLPPPVVALPGHPDRTELFIIIVRGGLPSPVVVLPGGPALTRRRCTRGSPGLP